MTDKKMTDEVNWHGKPYYSLDAYCKNTYGEKLYKIALNAGLTCPNRDGTLDTRGCIFCSAGGSGDFAITICETGQAGSETVPPLSIDRQLAAGKALLDRKHTGRRYIAYFQAYTNTYGPPSYLRDIYETALASDMVCGISIATRPDCITEDILTLLVDIREKFPDKFVWIELGLQTIHEKSARFIRRGYDLTCFDTTVSALHTFQIPVIVHVIIGLPGERQSDILQTIDYLNQQPIWGIKLQLLHILKGTDLATLYLAGSVPVLDKESYLDILIHCLERLSPKTVVHRLTGDGPKDLLLAPLWSLNKRDVLNSLHHEMKIRNTFQGRDFIKLRKA
ncbi:MAG: TIGR01212 family radical SAM protein [Roseburia sp.]|nr:TIGR01212 family radical SAM protein [Roseburia sp.]MCM1242887.1 TIGR01212 family radical SAM protein [Roseburia sp.]